jgi:hypothetical protein
MGRIHTDFRLIHPRNSAASVKSAVYLCQILYAQFLAFRSLYSILKGLNDKTPVALRSLAFGVPASWSTSD